MIKLFSSILINCVSLIKAVGSLPSRYLRRKINDYRLYQAMEETRLLDEQLRRLSVAREALSPANQQIIPVNHITHTRVQ